MQAYQREFIQFALARGVLKWGEFTLKSGRISPYFFNAGLFNSGATLSKLGSYYAQALTHANINYDILLGPAYKGIPLVAATSVALYEQYNQDIPYVFNRKEAKNHGEGGQLVGAPLQGKVVIVDDVITAGTAIGEVMTLVQASDAKPAAVLIALNRMEKGQGEVSAITEIEQRYQIPVISIISFNDLLEYLQEQPNLTRELDTMQKYRQLYGVR